MPIETQTLVVAEYLYNAGEKLSCHFTVEYTEGSSIWARTVTPLDANVTTVPKLVKELREKLPEMEVKVNRKQKDHPVIHLIEKPLAKKKNNVLEKEVDLQYSGVVGMIAAELEKSIPEITPPRSGPSTEFGNDHVTKVRIDVKNQTIRELLTHCVPLDQYNRVIWVAKSYVYQGKSTTSVRFIGPKN